MKHKLFAFLAVAALVLTGTTTAFASEGIELPVATSDEITDISNEIIDISDLYGTASEENLVLAVGAEQVKPYDIEFQQIGEKSYIIQKYEVPADKAGLDQFPKSLALGDVTYSLLDVLQKQLPGEPEVKTVFDQVVISTDTNNEADILAQLAPLKDYDDGTYSGQLTLDTANLSTTSAGTSSYSYAVNTTREFSGLDRADLAYIPKTVTNDYGQTLQLQDVDWMPMGGGYGNGLASAYNATAIYSGTSTGTRVTGYTTVARYIGEVSKPVPGNILYSVIYELDPPVEVPAMWPKVVIGIVVFIIIFAGALFGYAMLSRGTKKKRRGIWNA